MYWHKVVNIQLYFCSYIDLDSGRAKVVKYKSLEPAYLEGVRAYKYRKSGNFNVAKFS